MGDQPLALALGLAAAAVLSLALTVLASVRRRRRELALLKTLGMTRRPGPGHRRLADERDPDHRGGRRRAARHRRRAAGPGSASPTRWASCP